MKVDTVVTLDDGEKYLLLLKDEFMEDNYFLAVLLSDKDEPTGEYIVLKQIINNGELYTQRVKNPIILSQLLDDYKKQYEKEFSN